jgi:phage shock protein A
MMGKITPLFGSHEGEPIPEGESIANGFIAEMNAHVVAAKDQIAASQKEERRFAVQAEEAARGAGEWETRAMAAVRAGDDVVARDALVRKRQHELEYDRHRAAERHHNQQTATLTRALVTLNFRIDEAKRRQNTVTVRASRGERAEFAERTEALPLVDDEPEAPVPASTEANAMQKRLEATMSEIGTELELSDEAIANLAREAGHALRAQDELSRQKREAVDPPAFASKPLAKTQPSDAASTDILPSQVALSGPQRTKR